MCIWTMLAGATIGSAMAQDVPYGVGDWPEALGNHRARIRVEQPADAVWVHLPWRRRDAVPDRIDIIVIDGATNQRIENVLRVNIQRQSGDLLFQPVTVPGEYFVYYLPFKTEGSWYFPTTVYLPPGNTAQPAWVVRVPAAGRTVAQRKHGGSACCARAGVSGAQRLPPFRSDGGCGLGRGDERARGRSSRPAVSALSGGPPVSDPHDGRTAAALGAQRPEHVLCRRGLPR